MLDISQIVDIGQTTKKRLDADAQPPSLNFQLFP